jgi:hypothetical protein
MLLSALVATLGVVALSREVPVTVLAAENGQPVACHIIAGTAASGGAAADEVGASAPSGRATLALRAGVWTIQARGDGLWSAPTTYTVGTSHDAVVLTAWRSGRVVVPFNLPAGDTVAGPHRRRGQCPKDGSAVPGDPSHAGHLSGGRNRKLDV